MYHAKTFVWPTLQSISSIPSPWNAGFFCKRIDCWHVVSLEVKKVSSIAANDLSWASLLHNPPQFNNLPNDGLSSISDSFAPSTDKDKRGKGTRKPVYDRTQGIHRLAKRAIKHVRFSRTWCAHEWVSFFSVLPTPKMTAILHGWSNAKSKEGNKFCLTSWQRSSRLALSFGHFIRRQIFTPRRWNYCIPRPAKLLSVILFWCSSNHMHGQLYYDNWNHQLDIKLKGAAVSRYSVK